MKYSVTGMTCAACSARVEKTVKSLKGVETCSVSLLTNSMEVVGEVLPSEVISAVNKIGYGASEYGKISTVEKDSFRSIKVKMILSLALVICLMYFSMGHMFKLPLPLFFYNNYLALAFLQFLLSTIVLVLNQRFFINGFKGILKGSCNMDTLVAIGSGSSFIYSIYLVFRMTMGENHIHGLYFDSAAMILTLISVGKMLEEHSKGKTTNALKALVSMKPKTATILLNGVEKVVDVDKVNVDDIFVVKPGESIPVDGILIEGFSTVDESALTGESVPIEKCVGKKVFAASVNKSGYMKCRATETGEDTTLAKIIKVVSDASASKAPIAKIADKISGIFVPTVISIALLTFFIWIFLNKNFSFAFERAISVLVISCPCALGLATPVAIMVGSGVAAKNGILFKNASALEESGRINTVVLDKTGTITKGKPEVTDIFSDNESLLLKYACSLEAKSEHPLGKAIVEIGKKRKIEIFETSNFLSYGGKGVSCNINGKTVYGGNYSFVKDIIKDAFFEKADEFAEEGKTPLYFCTDDEFLGIIAVADTIKEDSIETVKRFKDIGIKVIMITGDNVKTAKYISERVGIDDFKAEVMPEEKAHYINEFKKSGKVAMVGDGINDAPALTIADVGIAIGAGTDIAIESASVVLMNDKIIDAYNTIKIGKAVLKNIKQNLFWAFFYNCIGIPLAAGAFIHILSWELNPMFGAAAMSLSSFFVISNALRLNLINLNRRESKEMKKVVKIGGMMCGHCEARVKKLLEALPQVNEAVVSHEKGTAILSLNDTLSDEVIKKVIEDDGYIFG